MSGRRAGGEPGSPGARRAASSNSHIAAMQLFHELKQQFPALPDHAVSACIAQHCHDPTICHSHLSQAAALRATPYPTSLRTTESTSPSDNQDTPKTDFNSSEDFKSIVENSEETRTSPAKRSFFSSSNKQTDYRRISDSSEDQFPVKTSSATKRFSDFTSRARSALFGLVDNKKTSETSPKSRSSLSSPKMDRKHNEKHTDSTFSEGRSPKLESSDEKLDVTSSPRMETSSKSRSFLSSPKMDRKHNEKHTESAICQGRSPKFEDSDEFSKKLDVTSSPRMETSPKSRSSLSSPKMDKKHIESAICQKRSPKFESSDEFSKKLDLTSSPRMEASPKSRSSLLSPKMDKKHTESGTSQGRSPKFEDSDEYLTSSPRMARSSLSVDKPPNFEFPAKTPIEISPGLTNKLKKSSETQTEFPQPSVSAVSDRTSPQSPSEAKDFSPFSKPPISPLTSKRPPKAAIDARISKVPEENATSTGAVRKTPVRPATLDLPNKTSDCVEPVGVNLSVNVNVDVEQGQGQGTRRHSTVLEVTPEPTWLHQTPPSPRSFTSVNLTLRTPTTPPQGPINICSSPASFTYTTNSWDRRQGLQSRLQITVGPAAGVGSVTAVRTRPRSCYQEEEGARGKVRAESMPDLCQVEESTNRVVLLSRQKERKEQLRNELKAGKERLHSIQKEIQALKLENTPDFRTRLKKEIKHLQAQCERLTREVDRHSESRVPLGETNAEFYRHIYTGQRHPSQRRRAPMPPSAAAEDNEPRWPCHICTFRNHPSMDKCEVCEMPRRLLGKLAAPQTAGSTSTNPTHANTPLALGIGMNS